VAAAALAAGAGVAAAALAAGAGAVYLLGRIMFAKGYYTGDPDKRVHGGFGMVGLLALVGSTLCFAGHQLNWTHPAWMKC